MPRIDYKRCKGCKRHTDECGTLSHTRLCEDCGGERRLENFVGLHTKQGPAYDHWKRRNFMAARKLLLDDERQSA